MLLWECSCDPVVKIRHSGRDLDCTCNKCKSKFELQEDSLPPAHGTGMGNVAPVAKIARAKRRPAKGVKSKVVRRRHNKTGTLVRKGKATAKRSPKAKPVKPAKGKRLGRVKPSELALGKALAGVHKPLGKKA